MFGRPWRWLIAGLAAVIIIGVANMVISALGGSEFLGLGTAGRAVLLVAVSASISVFVLPSQARLEEGREPMPPLPDASSIRRQQQG